jgi:hypothetical protein
MTDPSVSYDRDRIMRLIMARCPELSDAARAALGAAPDPDALPATIGQQILDAISFMMDRLDRIERAVRAA